MGTHQEGGRPGEPVDLPTRRTRIFDPPPDLEELRRDGPSCPVRLADTTVGVLVTGLDVAQAVLRDPSFSVRPELRTPGPGRSPDAAAAPGFFVRQDDPEHARYRKLIARQFTRRRMCEMVPAIVRVVDDHLDALATVDAAQHPVDLKERFTDPVPALVIGELLGVGEQDRAAFAADSRTMVDLTAGPEAVGVAMERVRDLLAATVRRARRDRRDGLIGALAHDSGLSEDELTAMSVLLLVAGYETTSNAASLSVFALLCHASALLDFTTAVQASSDDSEDPAIGRAVEELMRFLSVNQFGAMRIATRAGDVGGCPVAPGNPVILSLPAVNRDPAAFADPNRIDLARSPNEHLAFGYGPHRCAGAALAQLELRIMLARLFRRFDSLRLAVPPREVPVRWQMSVYGTHELPVTWNRQV